MLAQINSTHHNSSQFNSMCVRVYDDFDVGGGRGGAIVELQVGCVQRSWILSVMAMLQQLSTPLRFSDGK
jgi:hypothetical protein